MINKENLQGQEKIDLFDSFLFDQNKQDLIENICEQVESNCIDRKNARVLSNTVYNALQRSVRK